MVDWADKGIGGFRFPTLTVLTTSLYRGPIDTFTDISFNAVLVRVVVLSFLNDRHSLPSFSKPVVVIVIVYGQKMEM